jgi:hypothetical protein
MNSKPTAFAVLDILGYGALMAKEPEIVLSLVQELLQSSVRNWPVQRDLNQFARFSGSESVPVIEYLQFSDTLLIYLSQNDSVPKPLQTPGQLVESVCYSASLTLATFIASGIPLRGAVGFGPTFISREPLFFTGVELYETLKLEREQAWAGAAIHRSAKKTIEIGQEETFAVKYSVPMTDAKSESVEYAIDWVSCLACCKIVPPWDTIFSSSSSKVLRKRHETKRFCDILESQHRSFPVLMSKKTIESVRNRLSRLLC